ncbi:MAG TPA: 50S ribosomal protein L25 [Gaiellaceae bacterium]|jgi:large subunit ribosomal protein L25|nr:50S ribosomal protein L25 [Gaiellaceae bacterium]
MAGERIQLGVKARETAGSAESRRLRAAGMVPGVLYGAGKKAHPFTVEERELRRVLTGDHGLHAILDVVFDGQKTAHHAVLKEYQLDPVRPRLLHIDLHEVRLDQAIQAQVAVEPFGESAGVKEGGVLTLVLREINVEALPMEVPDRFEVDITELAIGDSLRVGDIRPPEGVTILDDPEAVVLNVTPPTKIEEPEVEEAEELEEGELPEGVEAEEGAEPEAEGESAEAEPDESE